MLAQSPKREQICWKTVGAAGGVAWLAVACLTGAVWIVGRQSMRPGGPSATPQLAEVASRPPLTQAPPKIQESPSTEAMKEPVTSSTKLPAGLPLLGRQENKIALPQGLPMSEQALGMKPVDFEKHNTEVAFVGSPLEAARLAAKERKLLFLLHLSGNFEEAGFT